ncbi:proteasome subunit beta [Streptomyces sp. SID12501]|uniref:Proteasome subunit beta n=1 Tax=Streptomyces sp. SID12501 TaxID=2706042 RepID=A0A6B3BSV3_9ACTN|nr:proteasome subunit beta [Streptomyces sp. SID12501]NEC87427.1 proteasome subunit beta [Streptomyces sp. SID12501]
MTGHESAGRLDAEFFAPGSSFIQFVQAHRPELLSLERVIPEEIRVAQDQVPHGTTVLALTYGDGVMIAGDRRATMGHLIAQRDLEKVHATDDYTAVAFAGTVGLAIDLVKLYQVELTHFEKIEGVPMTLNAKATRLATMVRQNLGQAMQGLAVVPLLAGYEPSAPEGQRSRIFSFDVTGGPYEKRDFYAEGSGSPYARGSLKKLYRPGMSRREAALAALQALYDAADDDSATGGPDLSRRIFPIISVITEDGFERLSEQETESLSREMVEQRWRRPDGPVATL